jgi:uncharacterized protein (TIGR03435 family)
MARRSALLVIAIALSLPELRAQAPAQSGLPSFEAVSLKEGSAATRLSLQWQGPRLVGGGLPLQTLLVVAYQLPLYQLRDLPEWIRTTRYDISALASRVPTLAEQPLLMRALLVERFKIVTRTDTRERPIYVLTMARADRQTGPRLRPTSFDCGAVLTARAAGNGAGLPPCRTLIAAGAYVRDGIPIELVTDILSTRLERPVIDKTGLTGFFDVELRFQPVAGAAPAQTDASDPDLFTAVREQLGLKLESARGPVPVTVFERIERPEAN